MNLGNHSRFWSALALLALVSLCTVLGYALVVLARLLIRDKLWGRFPHAGAACQSAHERRSCVG